VSDGFLSIIFPSRIWFASLVNNSEKSSVEVTIGSARFASLGSKKWANQQLSFAIRVLQGRACGSNWAGNLQLALIIKGRLLDLGFEWQTARIDNWIHRLQPRKADSRKDEKREASL